jgi:prevent-host-death family protein
MRRIQSSEAKSRFSELLDDVERGETIVVTRHGRDIAQIIPSGEQRKANVARAIERIKRLQKENGRITVEEILAARDEGRKQ